MEYYNIIMIIYYIAYIHIDYYIYIYLYNRYIIINDKTENQIVYEPGTIAFYHRH